jgi:phosphate transport system permease protein
VRARSDRGRRATDLAVRAVSALAAGVGIFFLVWILVVVLGRGVQAINWDFFLKLPNPPGSGGGGGLANAFLGSGLITLMATLVGVPLGLLAGMYLSEFGRESKSGAWIRFGANVLMGVPSIIIGVFVYSLIVVRQGHYSGYAGAVGLAILMLPVVARTTEDMLHLVPNALREAALALGAPRWKVTLGVVFRAARTGVVTGALLAIARVAGETAPLLFTALNSPFWPASLDQPTANLTVTIFNYAMSPYDDWQALAWGASFMITATVLGVNILTRLVLHRSPNR